MKYKNYILIVIAVIFAIYLFVNSAKADATTTEPIKPGSIVVVQNYRGAPFTWERWLKPIMYVWVEAGKTLVCVFNPNYSEVNTCNK